jgi:hypothetical protein
MGRILQAECYPEMGIYNHYMAGNSIFVTHIKISYQTSKEN